MGTPEGIGDLPTLLKGIPLFASIKPKMMDALIEGVAFRRVPSGAVLVRQGEFTEELLVVVKGIATSYRSDPEGGTENLGSHGALDWFGEMTALSHQAQPATVVAERPCTLLVVDAPLFKKLYTGGGSFTDLVDARYRERALALHLRTAPIFKGLDKDVLKGLAREAELITFPENKAIAQKGQEADAVFLVRSGVVKAVEKGPAGEKVIAYLCANSSFGERTLSDDRVWPHDMVAMTRVDVVRLSAAVFQRLKKRDTSAHTRIQRTVMFLLEEEAGKTTSRAMVAPGPQLSRTEQVELMVGKQAVKGGEALVIDLKKCTRCNACVESCVAVHEDRVPRLSKQGIRSGDLMLTSACYNCKIPECMLGCNYGAIRRDVNGAIHFIFENCTGCSACEVKCPYGVIRMTALVDPEEAAKEKRSFFSRLLPFVGRARAKPEAPADAAAEGAAADAAKPKKVEKKAIKCDLCAGLPFEACVYNCPCGAIMRMSPEAVVAR